MGETNHFQSHTSAEHLKSRTVSSFGIVHMYPSLEDFIKKQKKNQDHLFMTDITPFLEGLNVFPPLANCANWN